MRYDRINMTVQGQKTGEARLTAYLLDPVSVLPKRARPLVIVVPGGGYQYCSDREREPIVMKFLAMGCHACILDYSVSPNRFPVALRELALAIATVRDHAKDWHVDPESVLVCGFSAGGHLACSIGTFWNRSVTYEGIGRKAEEYLRSDFNRHRCCFWSIIVWIGSLDKGGPHSPAAAVRSEKSL